MKCSQRSSAPAAARSRSGPSWASRGIALGRLGQPTDIADVVAFLVSDDGRSSTGATIDASGGTWLGPGAG
jgi:NAD(P)-dependent dehydrogenase (short-subunit alcohol dehydrogenase family)